MKKYKHGSAVTVYLSGRTLEELDRYKVQYGTSRSELIEESVISYLTSLPSEEEWKELFEEDKKKHEERI